MAGVDCTHHLPRTGNTILVTLSSYFNTLRPRQDGRHFPDDIFKCIFLNENARISLKISLKVVPKVRINNIPALVQIMAWRRPGDKPLSEPMMVSLPMIYASLGLNELTHFTICTSTGIQSADQLHWLGKVNKAPGQQCSIQQCSNCRMPFLFRSFQGQIFPHSTIQT